MPEAQDVCTVLRADDNLSNKPTIMGSMNLKAIQDILGARLIPKKACNVRGLVDVQ